MKRKHFLVVSSCFAVLMSAAAKAALVDVDFSPGAGVAQTGAAVLGSAGDTWNTFGAGSGSAVALSDVTGAATTLKLTYSSNFGGDDTGNSPMDAATTNLMRDFLAMNGLSMTLTGLTPSTAYQIVLYGAGTQAALSGNAAGGQGTTFTIAQPSGPAVVGKTTEVNPTTPTLGDRKISDGAGVAYTTVTANSDATGAMAIAVAFNSTSFSTAPVNGIQIQPASGTPEPAAVATTTIAGTLALLRRRRDQ